MGRISNLKNKLSRIGKREYIKILQILKNTSRSNMISSSELFASAERFRKTKGNYLTHIVLICEMRENRDIEEIPMHTDTMEDTFSMNNKYAIEKNKASYYIQDNGRKKLKTDYKPHATILIAIATFVLGLFILLYPDKS